jgi:hypothetical protein
MVDQMERARQARQELEGALDERHAAERRFEAVIGTSAEMSAYQRLRRATRRVAAAGGPRAADRERLPT